MQWSEAFNESEWDYGDAVQQTTDGGYIIAGSIANQGNAADIYLIKTNDIGIEEWSINFGESGVNRAIPFNKLSRWRIYN